ncbi:hypothetical protein ILP92_05070 [Maribius pontilimi]|uniref:Phage integrase family protein n=1 Tax=Palleronia pontilimi TaxID=1964209 RepID=A0A934I8A4_9RHOB|nr:hypothetical protein [Palleronia pontilimi]MBJ3762113.1 hypothetical protein [Palleronia pontilimi]
MEEDDELRWLIALVADTGMRLSEAAGLHRDDFQQDADGGHYVRVQPHRWRRLKTPGSAREILLVGSSLWAAKRIMDWQGDPEFAFPR